MRLCRQKARLARDKLGSSSPPGAYCIAPNIQGANGDPLLGANRRHPGQNS
nr:hypothetical protein [uncultured bacterium]